MGSIFVIKCVKIGSFSIIQDYTWADGDALRELIIEGDNATVMKTIMSSKVNYSRLGHIYEDIGCTALTLQTFSFCCVKRSANSAAHALAKYARQVDDEVVWLEEWMNKWMIVILWMNDYGFRFIIIIIIIIINLWIRIVIWIMN